MLVIDIIVVDFVVLNEMYQFCLYQLQPYEFYMPKSTVLTVSSIFAPGNNTVVLDDPLDK